MRVVAVHTEALGDRLLEAAAGADEVVLIAPFMKRDTLRRLLDGVDAEASVCCITRWRPEEILAGVSDLDVWPLLRDRGCTLGLISHLHAKYYRLDDVAFVGSANLTAAALDWRAQANLELLVEMLSDARLLDFEAAVRMKAVPVDEALYQRMRVLVDTLRPLDIPVESTSVESDSAWEDVRSKVEEERGGGLWIPESRTPQVLYDFYRGATDRLTRGAREAAARDLAAFPLPPDLEEEAFRTYVGWYLAQMPIVRRIDAFVAEPQRFGVVRSYLRRMDDYPNHRDPSRDWQTLMRWLLHFMPGQYEAWEANYSEIFVRATDKM